ncbi:MAG TPA: glycosyltransferase family 4 protein [Mycobacteriales bacterium]|nr:glycosyltransferase family 4 protein [Mycobacteriales bacterium]
MTRRLLWVSLADQRPRRELYWLSLMPDTQVTALAAERPQGKLTWQPATYRRPVRRFVEAGALAWVRGLDDLPPAYDWCASLELCSLVTGQVTRYARRRGLRQAVLTWENDPRQPLYGLPPYRSVTRATLAEADLFLCLIDAAADHLRVLGVDEARIRVVHPGTDLDLFRPADTPVTDPVLAYVSPVAANKGIDRVLGAFALVRQRLPEARLRVLGRGPAESLVRAAAADPDRGVEYLGAGDAVRVAAVLREAAVFVTAPRASWKWNEQFGLAYLEAMACGLPVVTTICGTNAEIVRPPNERVVDDPEAIADALLRLLEDPSCRRAIGAANRRYVEERHDQHTQAARMAAAFTTAESQ